MSKVSLKNMINLLDDKNIFIGLIQKITNIIYLNYSKYFKFKCQMDVGLFFLYIFWHSNFIFHSKIIS